MYVCILLLPCRRASVLVSWFWMESWPYLLPVDRHSPIFFFSIVPQGVYKTLILSLSLSVSILWREGFLACNYSAGYSFFWFSYPPFLWTQKKIHFPLIYSGNHHIYLASEESSTEKLLASVNFAPIPSGAIISEVNWLRSTRPSQRIVWLNKKSNLKTSPFATRFLPSLMVLKKLNRKNASFRCIWP